MGQRVGIGIIGFCGHAYTALEGWACLRAGGIDIDLVAVSSLDASSIPMDSLRDMQSDFSVYAHWTELIADSAIDVVVVDGPYHLHAEMTAAAMAHGKHVFCEKLVALTWDQLAVVSAAYKQHQQQASLHFWSMVALRYEDRFFTAQQAVKNGAIGIVRDVRMQKSYVHGTRPAWYGDRNLYGGTIPWVGSHALDLIYAIAGPVSAVSAMHNCGSAAYELTANIQCRHHDGSLSSAGLDFYRPQSAGSHSDDRLRIVGDDGIIEVIGNDVNIIDADGPRTLSLCSPAQSLFADGIHSIVTGETTLHTAEDVFAVTELCLHARDSADAAGTMVEF